MNKPALTIRHIFAEPDTATETFQVYFLLGQAGDREGGCLTSRWISTEMYYQENEDENEERGGRWRASHIQNLPNHIRPLMVYLQNSLNQMRQPLYCISAANEAPGIIRQLIGEADFLRVGPTAGFSGLSPNLPETPGTASFGDLSSKNLRSH